MIVIIVIIVIVIVKEMATKILMSYLKETLKIICRSLLHNFCICFTLGDIVK